MNQFRKFSAPSCIRSVWTKAVSISAGNHENADTSAPDTAADVVRATARQSG